MKVGGTELTVRQSDSRIEAQLREQMRFQNQSGERALGYLTGERQIDESDLLAFRQNVESMPPSHYCAAVTPNYFHGNLPDVEGFPGGDDFLSKPAEFFRVDARLPVEWPDPELSCFACGMYWATRVYGSDIDLVMFKVPEFGAGGRLGNIVDAVASTSLWIMSPRVIARLFSRGLFKTRRSPNYEQTRRFITEHQLIHPDEVWRTAKR